MPWLYKFLQVIHVVTRRPRSGKLIFSLDFATFSKTKKFLSNPLIYTNTCLSKNMSASKPEKRKVENGETCNDSVSKKMKEEDFLTKIAQSRTDVSASVAEFKFNKKRVRVLSKAQDFPDSSKGVVYWMSRDQRVQGMYSHG